MRQIPKVIPPRSRVRLVRNDPDSSRPDDVGREFRVGYYSRQDGLDCIWLVNEQGEFEQTTDKDHLMRCFEIESLTDERDFYGVKKRRLGHFAVRESRANGIVGVIDCFKQSTKPLMVKIAELRRRQTGHGGAKAELILKLRNRQFGPREVARLDTARHKWLLFC